ncbi:MAG: glycosyltransferase [Chitinophagaceae bacterium]|jgi:glycosyltransferase involved in cell wall biosynthesis
MRILILVQSEVCHHPRLLKAGDYFHANKHEVYLYNTVTGFATKSVYQSVIEKRNWKIFETDISKRNNASKFLWLLASLFFKLNNFIAKNTGKYLSFKHGSTKSFVFFPSTIKKIQFDYIVINLVDALPFACELAKKTGAKVIYDSQEYFKGQYSELDIQKYSWVKKAEATFVKECPIVLATTNVMKERLINDFATNANFFRVRNVPVKTNYYFKEKQDTTLKLVWHGYVIIPENIRGVHILLQAISVCKTPVHLYLQGKISESNSNLLQEKLRLLNITNKVTVLPPANPDAIVESLIGYDIGLAGELAAEENQQLTSSNKLFDYIAAGMAIIMPNLLGLAETVNEYKNGMLYEQGNYKQLAESIDYLNMNRKVLLQYKQASINASREELFWENEMQPVMQYMEELYTKKNNEQ